jgi:hypothetical protein
MPFQVWRLLRALVRSFGVHTARYPCASECQSFSPWLVQIPDHHSPVLCPNEDIVLVSFHLRSDLSASTHAYLPPVQADFGVQNDRRENDLTTDASAPSDNSHSAGMSDWLDDAQSKHSIQDHESDSTCRFDGNRTPQPDTVSEPQMLLPCSSVDPITDFSTSPTSYEPIADFSASVASPRQSPSPVSNNPSRSNVLRHQCQN